MPHEVTMPQLGMTQDTGRLVQWLKQAGEKITRGDLLFEVETDKATMEIEAQAEGFLTHVTAGEGDEVPVGKVIARISETADAPDDDTPRSHEPARAVPEPAIPPASPPATETTSKASIEPPSAPGRILASPKLRRIAREEGLDLARLARAGHPQPYHMRDLETLRSLLPEAASPAPSASMRLRAACPQDGFAEFARWAADAQGLADADALLAGLAGASLGHGETVVAVERFGAMRAYRVPRARRLSAVTASDDAPVLRVRDLRGTAIETVAIGAEALPVLTITQRGSALEIILECSAGQMDGPAAIALLDAFASRMREPLRHLF